MEGSRCPRPNDGGTELWLPSVPRRPCSVLVAARRMSWIGFWSRGEVVRMDSNAANSSVRAAKNDPPSRPRSFTLSSRARRGNCLLLVRCMGLLSRYGGTNGFDERSLYRVTFRVSTVSCGASSKRLYQLQLSGRKWWNGDIRKFWNLPCPDGICWLET